eukprot:9018530-Ditylum_brightwellii.AAC.1
MKKESIGCLNWGLRGEQMKFCLKRRIMVNCKDMGVLERLGARFVVGGQGSKYGNQDGNYGGKGGQQ